MHGFCGRFSESFVCLSAFVLIGNTYNVTRALSLLQRSNRFIT